MAEIPTVIRLLTQSPPSLQQKTIDRFFTPSAAFTHPFCRIWSFEGSRYVIWKIFQWYKIMSPRIEVEIHSVGWYLIENLLDIKTKALTGSAYDEDHLRLYVCLSQIFSIWLVPFHVAPVTLTTVLDLTTDPGDGLYYITKQEDLYQTSEFIKFLIPHFGHFLVLAFHTLATIFCVLGTVLLSPVIWLEEKGYIPGRAVKGGNVACNMERKIPEIRDE